MVLGVIALIVVAYLAASVRVIPEDQRAVVNRMGRFNGVKGPGLTVIPLGLDQAVRVSVAEQKVDVPPIEVRTRDDLTRRIHGEVAFRVIDPARAVYGTSDYRQAIAQLASTHLAAKCKEIDADEIGASSETIAADALKAMNEPLEKLGLHASHLSVMEA